MRYKEQIREYQAKGLGSEKKMWASIDVMEEAMEKLREKDPEIVINSSDFSCCVDAYSGQCLYY